MSPEAITNRLKTMEQLWELSINLMNAKEISEIESSKKRRFEDVDCQKFANGETFVSGRLSNLPN